LSRYTPATLAIFIENVGYEKIQQLEQMNVFNLARNYLGSFFRKKTTTSLRGGRLRKGRVVTALRTALNRVRKAAYIVLYPLDRLLYYFGFRYIGQVIICRKVK
jgi:hypothetical protein